MTYPQPTHPKRNKTKLAAFLYASRIWRQQDSMIEAMVEAGNFSGKEINAITDIGNEADANMFAINGLVLNGEPDKAASVWQTFCQDHRICLECGGELVMDISGQGDEVEQRLLCQSCGLESDWREIDDAGIELKELPF